jgi:hypothetical protein
MGREKQVQKTQANLECFSTKSLRALKMTEALHPKRMKTESKK